MQNYSDLLLSASHIFWQNTQTGFPLPLLLNEGIFFRLKAFILS